MRAHNIVILALPASTYDVSLGRTCWASGLSSRPPLISDSVTCKPSEQSDTLSHLGTQVSIYKSRKQGALASRNLACCKCHHDTVMPGYSKACRPCYALQAS